MSLYHSIACDKCKVVLGDFGESHARSGMTIYDDGVKFIKAHLGHPLRVSCDGWDEDHDPAYEYEKVAP